MKDQKSDALVFFGATGDLAFKKIFPALQAMIKRGHLNIPIIGVAKSGWNLGQLKARAKESIERHGDLDTTAFERLLGLLRYVDGDYNDLATFRDLRAQMGSAQRPAYYGSSSLVVETFRWFQSNEISDIGDVVDGAVATSA